MVRQEKYIFRFPLSTGKDCGWLVERYNKILLVIFIFMKYVVKGSDETVVNVDILGELRSVGDVVELDEAAALPLVEDGKLEFVGEAVGDENTTNSLESASADGQNDNVDNTGVAEETV